MNKSRQRVVVLLMLSALHRSAAIQAGVYEGVHDFAASNALVKVASATNNASPPPLSEIAAGLPVAVTIGTGNNSANFGFQWLDAIGTSVLIASNSAPEGRYEMWFVPGDVNSFTFKVWDSGNLTTNQFLDTSRATAMSNTLVAAGQTLSNALAGGGINTNLCLFARNTRTDQGLGSILYDATISYALTGSTLTVEGWYDGWAGATSDAHAHVDALHLIVLELAVVNGSGYASGGPATNGVVARTSGIGDSDRYYVISTNTFAGATHLAVVMQATNRTLYVNGTSVTNWVATQNGYSTSAFYGALLAFAQTAGAARMNEARISTVARYSGSFTPASGWTNDASTMALYHLDDPDAAQAVDSSTNGFALPLNAATASGGKSAAGREFWSTNLNDLARDVVAVAGRTNAEGFVFVSSVAGGGQWIGTGTFANAAALVAASNTLVAAIVSSNTALLTRTRLLRTNVLAALNTPVTLPATNGTAAISVTVIVGASTVPNLLLLEISGATTNPIDEVQSLPFGTTNTVTLKGLTSAGYSLAITNANGLCACGSASVNSDGPTHPNRIWF